MYTNHSRGVVVPPGLVENALGIILTQKQEDPLHDPVHVVTNLLDLVHDSVQPVQVLLPDHHDRGQDGLLEGDEVSREDV